MKLPATLLPVTLAVLSLTACGSSATKTVVLTRTTGTPPSSNPTTTGATPVGTSTPTTITGSLGTLPTATVNKAAALHAIASATATVHLTTFRSPTGNIGCLILDGIARCDISQRSWKPPPRPGSCSREVDFGQGLELGGSGKGQFVCAGDTALDPTGTPLRYGDASVEGGFTCLSATTGMTCINRPSGHGFFISRQSYSVF